MRQKFSLLTLWYLAPFIGMTLAQLGILRSLTETISPLIPRPTILDRCLPNPLPPLKLSPPFSNCDKTAREGLLFKHPFEKLNTSEVLNYYGYPFRNYNVTTSDGYILTLHRVFGPPNTSPTTGKRVAYLQHGVVQASDAWLLQYGSRNLVSILTAAGYEVWLVNGRGTFYSLGHRTLSSDDEKYWDFSFSELSLNDFPAIIDLILSETGQEKLFYVGHSLGTTQYMVALSEIPKLNEKIYAGFLLAPAGIFGHLNNPVRAIVPNLGLAQAAFNTVLGGRLDLQMARQRYNISLGALCDPTAQRCGVCNNLLFLFLGYNAPQLNTTEIPNIIAKSLNSISGKLIVHLGQLIRSCDFLKFDYGAERNRELYGSAVPPNYQVGKVTAPTYFYYGERDNLVPPNDVQTLANQFSPGVLRGVFKIDDELFNHGDFTYAKDADILVYNKIVQEMEKFK